MPDTDPKSLTAQDLTYGATGLRALARIARQDAEKQKSPTIRSTFEHAEQVYLNLAAKYDRIAKAKVAASEVARPQTPAKPGAVVPLTASSPQHSLRGRLR
jgi:hypothetical protein